MWFESESSWARIFSPSRLVCPRRIAGLPVLIVDDNLTHLQSLTGMVDSYGMAMTAVISALQEERQLVRGSG